MGHESSGAPDPSTVAKIRQMIAAPKTWVASGEMEWVDAGGRPPGFAFRERLALADGSQPASLFVKSYFKPSTVPGCADKLSIGLFFIQCRVFAVDENGPGGHFNSVGIGRSHFGKRVGFPHVHMVTDDSIEGYAEPLEPTALELHWAYFLSEAGIVGAPPFQLPTMQLGLLP